MLNSSKVLLLGVGSAALLAAACSAPTAPAPSAPAGGGDATGPVTPKVNRVVMAVEAPSTESNRVREIGQTTMWQIAPMYEYLIGMKPEDGTFVPQLATEWAVKPDGSAINFKLRKGVNFQGGFGEFTAKDVVFSHQDLTRDDATAGYQVQLAKNSIGSVDVVSDYEVNIVIKQKNSDLLNMISQAQGGFEILSKAAFDKNGDPNLTTPPLAGTGPYAMKSRTQSQNVIYERVAEKHWRLTPDFPEFEFRWVREPSTRLASLLAGEIHITSLPKDLMPQAESQGFKVAAGKVKALRTFVSYWCCYLKEGKYTDTSSPLHNVNVRKALSKAVDRNALNKAFFAGKGELIYGFNFLPDNHPGFNPQWKTDFDKEYGYDVEAAKKLLADAGYTAANPLKTTIFSHPLATYAGAQDVVEAMLGYWRAIGANVELSTMDQTQMSTASRNCQLTNHMDIIGTSGAPLGPYGYYNSSFIGNCGGYQTPETDVLYRKLLDELDVSKHGPLFKELGDVSYKMHSNLPLLWLPAEAVYNNKIIDGWVWPGSISGTWTHIETLKAAR